MSYLSAWHMAHGPNVHNDVTCMWGCAHPILQSQGNHIQGAFDEVGPEGAQLSETTIVLQEAKASASNSCNKSSSECRTNSGKSCLNL